MGRAAIHREVPMVVRMADRSRCGRRGSALEPSEGGRGGGIGYLYRPATFGAYYHAPHVRVILLPVSESQGVSLTGIHDPWFPVPARGVRRTASTCRTALGPHGPHRASALADKLRGASRC